MNERFKEIEKQCWKSIQSEPYALFDVKKFAELLIEECMDVVAKKCASPTAYNALAEHWGVEE